MFWCWVLEQMYRSMKNDLGRRGNIAFLFSFLFHALIIFFFFFWGDALIIFIYEYIRNILLGFLKVGSYCFANSFYCYNCFIFHMDINSILYSQTLIEIYGKYFSLFPYLLLTFSFFFHQNKQIYTFCYGWKKNRI